MYVRTNTLLHIYIHIYTNIRIHTHIYIHRHSYTKMLRQLGRTFSATGAYRYAPARISPQYMFTRFVQSDTKDIKKSGSEHKDVKENEHHHHNERTQMYKASVHHDSNRDHLWNDGTRKHAPPSDEFHWEDLWGHQADQEFVKVNGQTMIKGQETRDLGDLYRYPHNESVMIPQINLPFSPRRRLNIWGNHEFILKAEFLFFWIPTVIIWSLAIPAFTMIYLQDEAVYTTMTVKIIGRQWYWLYEVESPPEEDDE